MLAIFIYIESYFEKLQFKAETEGQKYRNILKFKSVPLTTDKKATKNKLQSKAFKTYL